MNHTPVLLEESLNLLSLQKGDVYLDATLGEGGHASEVWRRFGKEVEIIGIDADKESLERARARLEREGAEAKLEALNFRDLAKIKEVTDFGPTKILFDLGWNKSQFEEGGKGFSFQRDEPLLMTFGEAKEAPFTAETIANEWDEGNLKTIISAYGEERFAGRIARAIVEAREKKPIKTSLELANIVREAVPKRGFERIHPATRTFQSFRIAVNDELQALSEGLESAWGLLGREGRIAVISFHSLEDRIVKRFFKTKEDGEAGEILTKKPVTPTEREIEANPRSRSAKLRALRKL